MQNAYSTLTLLYVEGYEVIRKHAVEYLSKYLTKINIIFYSKSI